MNDGIVRGQGTATDLSEALDQRDAILKQLSDEIGIRTSVRSNGGAVIYAEGGAVLFDTSPRSVTFAASEPLPPGSEGHALVIDGVPVTGTGAPMPVTSGKIAGYARVRDQIAPQFSSQVDKIAAGLIAAFSESGTDPAQSLPQVEGLFQGTGSLPSIGSPSPGLARMIHLNGMADPDAGGNSMLIRDGGFGGTGYIRNISDQPGFQDHIADLVDSLDVNRSFGEFGGGSTDASLKNLGLKSAAWLQAQRSDAQSALDVSKATKLRAANALAQVTGVSVDQEMATLLDLEKSYQASSKVLSVVNSMLGVLMDALR